MSEYDVVVVGAGISGLSFAYYAAKAGKKVLVLEREQRVGGCVHSHRTPDGYWFEMGAHTAYNSYAGFLEIIEGLGLKDDLEPRVKAPFRLLHEGKLLPVTKQLSFVEAALSVPKIFFTKKDGRTVKDYYGAILGKKNFERLLSAFFAAVPSQNADAFPATMLFKKRPRRKDILRSYTLDGGLQTVADAAAKMEGVTVRMGETVEAVTPAADGCTVRLVGGDTLDATVVVMALPPRAARSVLREGYAELAAAMDAIDTAEVTSVGVVVPKTKVTLEPVAGIVPRNDTFFSAVSRDTVPDESRRAFAFHFRPDIEAKARKTRIAEVLQLGEDEVEIASEACRELPAPKLGHEDIVERIDYLTRDGSVRVIGNYFAGLALEDCVERARSEALRLFSATK